MIDREYRCDAGALGAFVANLFVAEGMDGERARELADVLVWADLRGVESHGVERVPRYLAFIAQGHLDPRGAPVLREVGPSAFVLSARKTAGPVAMMAALREAQTRARAHGVAFGVVAGTTHTGAIGYFAQQAAQRGMIGVAMAAGMPLMAYSGTRAASISTSPIAIAAPRAGHPPILLDMSTAVAAAGRLRKAQADGLPIPQGWALDAQGAPTTDPAAAVVSMPIAGAKGAGLSLMIEILCSVLGGAPIVARMARPGAARPHSANALVLLIDVARFRAPGEFGADVDELASVIQSLPRVDETSDVRMPGERGDAEASMRARHGVPIGSRLREELARAARARNTPLPDGWPEGA